MTVTVSGDSGPDIIRVYISRPAGSVYPEQQASTPDAIVVPIASDGFSGITENHHDLLHSLSHSLENDHFTEFVYSGENVTNVISWTSSSKLQKVREVAITYSQDGSVGSVVTDQYTASGLLSKTLTKTFTYVGENVSSINAATTP